MENDYTLLSFNNYGEIKMALYNSFVRKRLYRTLVATIYR